MKAMKAYRPDVHLAFEDMGMVGDALNGWDNSVPMQLKTGTESTWQLDTTLKSGYVKFRSHNNWEENWGGCTFPQGSAIFVGDDIPVTPGRYHIELDLVNGQYRFEKR